MKRLLAIAAVALSISGTANAQVNCRYIGAQRLCNGPNGAGSTSQTIGTQTFTHFNGGGSATSQQIGSQRFTHFSDGSSATSQQIGNQPHPFQRRHVGDDPADLDDHALQRRPDRDLPNHRDAGDLPLSSSAGLLTEVRPSLRRLSAKEKCDA